MEKFIAYTDGACTNNQGSGGQPGGWGVAFLDGRELSGGNKATTNNRMELTAAIEALRNTPKQSHVEIHSDSAYVVNAFNQNWIPNWIKRGWKTSQGKNVENQDLWKELITLANERSVKWVKVKGHSGDKWNDIADRLAVEAISTIDESGQSEDAKNNETVFITLERSQYNLLMDTLLTVRDNNEDLDKLYQLLLNK